MINYKEVVDSIAEIEHQQWKSWSVNLWFELWDIRKELDKTSDINTAIRNIDNIYHRWKKNWKPFFKLSEEEKCKDREWAEKVIPLVPIKCPVYQCGGLMFIKERKKPKEFIESFIEFEHRDGDEQTPDLVCSNCGAVYQFKGFKK